MSSMPSYPEKLEIKPLTRPPNATVRVPGSKSITNRALVLAALTGKGHNCTLRGILQSEDTEVMMAALRVLGFHVQADRDAHELVFTVSSEEGEPTIPSPKADLFVGNSGTTMRFLTAVVCLGRGRYRLDGVRRMRERPIDDLVGALGQLGIKARYEGAAGYPPVVVEAEGWRGGRVKIKGDISSQFVSGILLAAPFGDGETIIEVEGPLVSEPYVNMTVAMLRQIGKVIETGPGATFHIHGGQAGGFLGYTIEPDASTAGYFWAAAAIMAGSTTIPGLSMNSLQGDVRFIELLEDMGCLVVRGLEGLTAHGAPLHGIDADMNDISDTVMTLAAVACFAEGPTTIRNVAHIRHKETDRLAALATELRRVGAGVDEFADGLTITPQPLHGAEIETYNDHRMAMSMALIGLKVPGIVIKNPGCVAKTYPGFFADLEKLR
jgi:3-phosphoshikimate 1-carboxyvinyltransferase